MVAIIEQVRHISPTSFVGNENVIQGERVNVKSQEKDSSDIDPGQCLSPLTLLGTHTGSRLSQRHVRHGDAQIPKV